MRRKVWGTTLVAAVVLVAAGCGQSGAPGAEGSDRFEITTISDSTEAAGSARFEGSYEPSHASGSPAGDFEGEIDFANGRSATR